MTAGTMPPGPANASGRCGNGRFRRNGVSARFVQNRTLTGVGRATQTAGEAHALASPDFEQALQDICTAASGTFARAQGLLETIHQQAECRSLRTRRAEPLPSHGFRIRTIVPAYRAHAATP